MIDEKIVNFIKKHHVFTLATAINNRPWCSNCFYAYLETDNCLVFTTDDDTRHGQEALQNPHISGSIVLETDIIGKIRGLQFEGIMTKPTNELLNEAKKRYFKRFPYAMALKTNIWIVHFLKLKYTDNRLGFGTKLIWEANS